MPTIPIFRKEGENFKFKHEIIHELLNKPEYRDLPVAIVAIAGKFRQGKSFLLSHAVSHLSNREITNPNDIFEFKKSENRQTEGIDIFSDPIVVPKADGKKIVVLFMDTQGTFDTQTSFHDNNLIFGVAATISSLFLYNVKRQLEASDLQNFAFFLDFGLAAKQSGHKVYQDLMYIVRDWSNSDEFAYGFSGGRQMLDDHYKSSNSDIKDLHNKVSESFCSSGAFLCPYPGDRIFKDDFKGDIKELSPDFQEHFPQLLSNLLSSKALKPKLFNGKPLLCKDASTVMKILSDALLAAESPEDALTVMSRLFNQHDKNSAELEFNNRIAEIQPQLENITTDDLKKLLRKISNEVIITFLDRPKVGDRKTHCKSEKELEEYLEKRCKEVEELHERMHKRKEVEKSLKEEKRKLQEKRYMIISKKYEKEMQFKQRYEQLLREQEEQMQRLRDIETMSQQEGLEREEEMKRKAEEHNRKLEKMMKHHQESQARSNQAIQEIHERHNQILQQNVIFDREQTEQYRELHEKKQEIIENLKDDQQLFEMEYAKKVEMMNKEEEFRMKMMETRRKQAEELHERELEMIERQDREYRERLAREAEEKERIQRERDLVDMVAHQQMLEQAMKMANIEWNRDMEKVKEFLVDLPEKNLKHVIQIFMDNLSKK